jgi:hypothetical protein
MMDEARVEQASRLIQDEFFINELDLIKTTNLQRIANSANHELEEREDAYRMIKAVDAVRGHFEFIAAEKVLEDRRWKIF